MALDSADQADIEITLTPGSPMTATLSAKLGGADYTAHVTGMTAQLTPQTIQPAGQPPVQVWTGTVQVMTDLGVAVSLHGAINFTVSA